jgi:Zinc-binding dehydrogenase
VRGWLGAFAASGVRPVIDRTFGFDDVPAAFGYLRSGGHLGKIVIERRVGPSPALTGMARGAAAPGVTHVPARRPRPD